MKIRIMKSSGPGYWYTDRIGEEFEVEEPDEASAASGAGVAFFVVKNPQGTLGFSYSVSAGDCDVIGDQDQSATVPINRSGYFVTSWLHPGEVRTYACTDKAALAALLLHLTGRTLDTFVEDERGVPRCSGLSIGYPCHIYGAQEPEETER